MAATIVLTTNHPKQQCVDLRATFGGQYRFAWDDAYEAERPEFRAVEAPWLTIIPGKFGKIFPWGGRRLAAYSRAGATKRQALEDLPGVTVAQGGTVGGSICPDVVVTFAVELIEAVAAVLGSKRPRKRLPPERRAAQIERLRAFRFPSARAAVNDAPAGLDSTNPPENDESVARPGDR